MERTDKIEGVAAGARVARLDLPELYNCVHCGLCLNACPTYRALHLEPESPRGRIHLVRAAAEGRIELNERFAEHLNLCLMCRACESACPSGVQYGRIAEAARAEIGPPGAPLARAVTRWALNRLLPSPRRLRVAGRLLRLYQQSGARRLVRPFLSRRLREMEAMLPAVPGRFFAPEAAARLYGGAGRPAIVYGLGVTEYFHGTDGVRALANLAILRGAVGTGRGFGVNPLRG